MRISDWSSDVCSSDLGPCAVGLESTVLDLSGARAAILRPGSITTHDLTPLIGEVGEAAESGGGGLKGPGMLLSHYAPGHPVRLDATSVAADEALLAFGPEVPRSAAATLNLSPDRKSVVTGKRVSVRVNLGGCG